MDEGTLTIYNRNAADFADRWERACHGASSILPHLFDRGSTVIEIGFGSGRDLSFLKTELAVEVYGVEPSENLLTEALRLHPELKNKVFLGGLPDSIPELPEALFDGVLLSAVLMHIPDEDLFQSAYRIRELLKTNGKLVISVPIERSDIKEGEKRDTEGRLMIIRPVSRIRLLFERIGFEIISTWESRDTLGRRGFRWVTLVFTYRGSYASESVDKIESIINRDRKTATYKLALLKALCDIAQTEEATVKWDKDGNVQVPLNSVVRKWIEYYWPIVTFNSFIPQTRGEHPQYKKPIAFRKSLTELISLYEIHGGSSQFSFDQMRNNFISSAQPFVKIVREKISNAIIRGPVYYAGGGSSDDKPFSYERETKSIVFHADIWREMVLLGHWIRDSISMRWAELSCELAPKNHPLQLHDILHLFISKPFFERNVNAARTLYSGRTDLECVWSGQKLHRKFDVDHAIPFVLRHDNSLWNLFPANPRINNQKRDKLPSQNLVSKNRDRLIFCWELLQENLPDLFSYDFSRFTGKELPTGGNWQNTLFWTFSEAVETTAARRGVERWEP